MQKQAVSHVAFFEYAFIVAIVLNTNNDTNVKCMGALVHRNWVLTTARCVEENNPTSSYTIVAGLVNFNITDGEQLNNVSEVVKHPMYKKESDEHNLAMIKVRNP